MDIVLSKNGVKCAIFKISDVQRLLNICYYRANNISVSHHIKANNEMSKGHRIQESSTNSLYVTLESFKFYTYLSYIPSPINNVVVTF